MPDVRKATLKHASILLPNNSIKLIHFDDYKYVVQFQIEISKPIEVILCILSSEEKFDFFDLILVLMIFCSKRVQYNSRSQMEFKRLLHHRTPPLIFNCWKVTDLCGRC
jgi:hypothetical protein